MNTDEDKLELLQAQRHGLYLKLHEIDDSINELTKTINKNAVPFNPQTLTAWIDARVVAEPIITTNTGNEPEQKPNTRLSELQVLLMDTYAKGLLEYDRDDLAEECMEYIINGVDQPLMQMTEEEIIGELTSDDGPLLSNFEILTINDLEKEFGD